MARKAMVFFLTLCCMLLGWAALAMGEKLEGREPCRQQTRLVQTDKGESPRLLS